MNETKKNILLGMIIGDAIGSGFDGLGRGHIRSHFKEIGGYPDPAPALKGRMERWRKPGFYSSISQFGLLVAACPQGTAVAESFTEYIVRCPEVKESESGVFRHPDGVEKNLIARIKNPGRQIAIPEQPSVRVISSSIPLSLRDNSFFEQIIDAISYVRLFTRDVSTLSGALSITSLLRYLMEDRPPSTNYSEACLESNGLLIEEISANPGALFNSGINPGALEAGLKELNDILSPVANIKDETEAEAVICARMNNRLKTPITRASVNIPHALIPYALVLSAIHGDDPSALYQAAMKGGSAAALTALCGSLRACVFGTTAIPEILVQNLANRKKVTAIVNSLKDGAISAPAIEDFLRTEASLTGKEGEELRAKQRHNRKKPKHDMPRPDRESKLSKYAVESWTKIDKARWRNEKKKMDKNIP